MSPSLLSEAQFVFPAIWGQKLSPPLTLEPKYSSILCIGKDEIQIPPYLPPARVLGPSGETKAAAISVGDFF